MNHRSIGPLSKTGPWASRSGPRAEEGASLFEMESSTPKGTPPKIRGARGVNECHPSL